MHNKIICISSSLEDNTCPLDESDFDKLVYELGADWGGDLDDVEQTEYYLQSMFGDFATIERIEDDDEDSNITHKLHLDRDAAVRMVDAWLTSFKQQVDELSLDMVLTDDWSSGRHAIDKALDYSVSFENVVYINCEFKSVIDFAIQWLNYSKNEVKPLYVCGCVDYHW